MGVWVSIDGRRGAVSEEVEGRRGWWFWAYRDKALKNGKWAWPRRQEKRRGGIKPEMNDFSWIIFAALEFEGLTS